jgi:hypothetical protein
MLSSTHETNLQQDEAAFQAPLAAVLPLLHRSHDAFIHGAETFTQNRLMETVSDRRLQHVPTGKIAKSATVLRFGIQKSSKHAIVVFT